MAVCRFHLVRLQPQVVAVGSGGLLVHAPCAVDGGQESPVQRPLRVWNEKLAEAWPESGSDGGAETTLGRELPACGDEAAGWAVVPVVYCTGTVCMLLFWILGYVRVWRLVKCGTCRREKKWTEVWTDEPVGAFCVGRWLVMNRADYRDFPLIRLHELMQSATATRGTNA